MTNETTKVGENNYDEILKLLKSDDKPSVHIALSILECCNIKDSRIYILLLLKHLSIDYNRLVKDEYENIYNLLYNDNGEAKVILSYKYIYNMCKTDKEKNFLLSKFKTELVSFLDDYGFQFLKDCDLVINTKNSKNE